MELDGIGSQTILLSLNMREDTERGDFPIYPVSFQSDVSHGDELDIPQCGAATARFRPNIASESNSEFALPM
jgi:hypothetical protein